MAAKALEFEKGSSDLRRTSGTFRQTPTVSHSYDMMTFLYSFPFQSIQYLST